MVATNFDASLKLVLLNEGGWSDDPRDSGGATNRGIALASRVRCDVRAGPHGGPMKPLRTALAWLKPKLPPLVDNWERVLAHAWSVHMNIVIAVVCGASAALEVTVGLFPIPPLWLILAVGIASAASIYLRTVKQKKVSG